MADLIPQLDPQTGSGPRDPIGHLLFVASRFSALFGAAILVALCLMVTASVLARWLIAKVIPGDVELVQIGCALAVASFLPYAQMKNAHVIVDFFTLNAPARLKRALDRIAALLLATGAGMIAWRSFAGTWDMYRSGETSLILELPLWWAYVTLGPGFLLLCATALYTAWKIAPRVDGGVE